MHEIRLANLDDPRVIDLLTTHVTRARQATAFGSAHALDLAALKRPELTLWTAWDNETLLGIAALNRLSATVGEVKSMHIAQRARRTGVGSTLLNHLIAHARAAGLQSLYLETGAGHYFAPARAFYTRHGFTETAPFADYTPDPNSVFMRLKLE